MYVFEHWDHYQTDVDVNDQKSIYSFNSFLPKIDYKLLLSKKSILTLILVYYNFQQLLFINPLSPMSVL